VGVAAFGQNVTLMLSSRNTSTSALIATAKRNLSMQKFLKVLGRSEISHKRPDEAGNFASRKD